MCVQEEGDRAAAIIQPDLPGNDGFIGEMSKSSAFGGDTVSEGSVFGCHNPSRSMTNQSGCVMMFGSKGSMTSTRSDNKTNRGPGD